MQFTKLLRTKLNLVMRSPLSLLPQNTSPEPKILIAVSGGQDSICLAKLLQMQQAKFGWHLAIAHCDHRWREDSQANADHVARFAQDLGLDFILRTADIVPKSEASARHWRYEMLAEMAKKHDCGYVVTGHTRSDRVETCLYNLMRGSGADGLAALSWRRSLTDGIELVRPLLNVSRAETAGFCMENQIAIWEDSTNADLSYRRNRLRLETIPYLQANFNPQLEVAIAQTAELLQEDVRYLENQAQNFFQENITVVWNEPPRLQCELLREQPLALQRRIVRQFLGRYLKHQVNFEDVERFLNLLTVQNRSQSSPFTGQLVAMLEHPWIVLQSRLANNHDT
ncbi:tRNA lysidine(34) synthetase TilS [Pseudanabaena sp. FACHB-1277]|uniref:tRNA(Ile)-lysidine synthase n=1 Tax=Pseudanabaena cinerea FACHB-1277 TaxID=2949581 RepID=A0A926UUB2_9CYAN|nr:tRNA lysidine(34) synthetase TilS [Pseudanabaena cinerea]MBD2151013.1 tRNA lysidine(34) synthetase TilS [Pseudanabaena cinerea FACHB-1277]